MARRKVEGINYGATSGKYYDLVDYFDVWGNEEDGWEVNNQSVEADDIFISDDTTDEELLDYLKGIRYFNQDVKLSDIYIDWGDGDFIEIFKADDMMPICSLRINEYSKLDYKESYKKESKGGDPYEIIKLNKDHYVQRLSQEWEGTPKSSWEDIFENIFDEFTRYADDEVSDFILDKFDNGEITADDVDAEFDNFLTFWIDDINEYDIFDEACGSRKKSKKKKIVNQGCSSKEGCGSKKVTDESAGVPSESQFVNAYTWSYGTTKAKAKQVYKDCKKDGDIEYIKAIVDGFEGNAKKSFYNDSKKPKKITKESGKKKYTQKDIKDYVDKGMATDITHYSFDEANKFYKDHNYDVVGISHGTYGMNGALLQDVDTKEYFAITARNSTLFQLV